MYLERDGVRLYYELHGMGEPTLLFVHGWLTSADIWKDQIAEFGKRHRVIAVDLRGFGHSDRPKVEYTFDLFADDIDFVLHQLGMERSVFIGWSKGVSIGLVYAARHPKGLSKLVLVCGGPKFIQSEDFPVGLPAADFERTLEQMRSNWEKGARAFVEAMIPEPGTEALRDRVFDLARRTSPEVALNSIQNDARYDLRPLLGRITVPTLIFYGDLDTICPPGASFVMHEGIPNSEIVGFNGLGHMPFLVDPQQFNRRLETFLSREVTRV